ncbi:MAG TPA: amino acid permease [Candidatus Acidoferrales bacterium]|nr:amino acid permease [Candidatus Acidoferrales bacterium]
MTPQGPAVGRPATDAVEREKGLKRQLSARQMAMIGIGGALGIGFFLRSSLGIHIAGPAVVLTYVFAALIGMLFASALAEMAVAHPTAGSFGVYAELYVSRWAGFVVRYTYWFSMATGLGGQATAVAIYCQWWFPSVPGWIWIVLVSAALIYVNTLKVGRFGEVEYWLSMIKIMAICFFILFGVSLLGGLGHASPLGLRNFRLAGGFFPNGWGGAWSAIVFVIASFGGLEMIAVTAGEAKDPQRTVPKALRNMVVRLTLVYVGAMVVLIGVVPWNQIQPGRDVTASPFVTVFQLTGVPAAAHIMNFVVLMAAVSSMNTGFYIAGRMLFSLARGGYAPERFGRLSTRGTPVSAVLVSALGLAIAAAVTKMYPTSAFIYFAGLTLFGLMFVWLMVFVTQLFFRRKWRAEGCPLSAPMIGYPFTTILGLILVAAVLATTWWVERMRITILSGLAWLAFISLAYWIWAKQHRPPREALSPKAGLAGAGTDAGR